MNANVFLPAAWTAWIFDEDGATAVEYAVMLGLIVAVAYFAISLLGGGTQGRWRDNTDSIINASKAASNGS